MLYAYKEEYDHFANPDDEIIATVTESVESLNSNRMSRFISVD